jgi:hypothetical protein
MLSEHASSKVTIYSLTIQRNNDICYTVFREVQNGDFRASIPARSTAISVLAL